MEEDLGIIIYHNDDGSYQISQPLLIDQIIESVPGMADPAVLTPIMLQYRTYEGKIRRIKERTVEI